MAKKKSDARPFWTGDCETDPFRNGRVPQPFIWGLWTGAGFHEFLTAEEFVEFIKDCDVIIYFHNGGRFDFFYLLRHLNLAEPMKVINGRLVVGHIGKAEIRDSWNLLPIPLAEYKKQSEKDFRDAFIAHGMDKKTAAKLATDYNFMEAEHRDKPQVRPVIREYLRDDCVDLHNLIAQFEKDYGRHLTMAGASLAMWKKMSGLPAPETDRDFFINFVRFYFGGRVECFKKGKIEGPVEIVDIKSAYPDAMMSPHPYDPEYIETHAPSSFLDTSFVTVDCVSNGALPYRGERGQITFPHDGELRRYHVPGHELRAAMETGALNRVDLVHAYDFTNLVSFAPYIKHFYALRKLAKADLNKAVDIFCKLFMNSLSGKFGANPDNYGNFMCVDFQSMEDYLHDGYEFDGMIGPHALLRAPLDEWQCRFINVATIASITSQVRAKLWRGMDASEETYYTDTDCMMTRKANVDIGDNLGQWEFEGTASRIYIAGKKMYYAEGMDKLNPRTGKLEPKMASKGVRITPKQIIRMCEGHTEIYEPKAPVYTLKSRRKDKETGRRLSDPYFQNRAIRMT